ncbi:MAG: class I SAM-dependent methyltransferase [Chloroflexi bacterium]|nr:class I SAM-dependent methyltransferase [Chloroflexota bacterium]
MEKYAQLGAPSFVWREGQTRRLQMMLKALGPRFPHGLGLENGCGVGLYLARLRALGGRVIGLEYDFPWAQRAAQHGPVVNAAGEALPFPSNTFDYVISHEVIEHVQDDRAAVREMIRVLKIGGRLLLFCPNRGYPFETHGIYWRGRYIFGNIPFVNYLPRSWRDRLAPHVRIYTRRDLEALFEGLPVRFVQRTVIFGAYDNIIARWPRLGRALRWLLHRLERTPLRVFGLSHFWVVEKIADDAASTSRPDLDRG